MCKKHKRIKEPPPRAARGPAGRVRLGLLAAALLGLALLLGPGGDTRAALSDPFTGLEVLSEVEMAESRGGFAVPDLGIVVSFAATIKSQMVDPLNPGLGLQEVLRTFINFDNGVRSVTRQVQPAAASFSNLSFLTSDGSAVDSQTVLNSSAPISVAMNGSGVELGAGSNLEGVIQQGTNGVVALLHKVTGGQIANIAIATDAGRTVQQDLHVDIEIQGFDNLQQTLNINAIAAGIAKDMALSSLSALGD